MIAHRNDDRPAVLAVSSASSFSEVARIKWMKYGKLCRDVGPMVVERVTVHGSYTTFAFTWDEARPEPGDANPLPRHVTYDSNGYVINQIFSCCLPNGTPCDMSSFGAVGRPLESPLEYECYVRGKGDSFVDKLPIDPVDRLSMDGLKIADFQDIQALFPNDG